MSETIRELTCIGCPLGCSITVTMNDTDVDPSLETPVQEVMPMPEKKSQTQHVL